MNTDAIAKLAKFTPTSSVDHAELLFAAGRASARAHWAWQAAVGALLLTNTIAVGLFAFHPPAPGALPEPQSAPIVPTRQQPEPPQSGPPKGAVATDPWSYGALAAVGDPDRFPQSELIAGGHPPVAPLTVLAARRGEID